MHRLHSQRTEKSNQCHKSSGNPVSFKFSNVIYLNTHTLDLFFVKSGYDAFVLAFNIGEKKRYLTNVKIYLFGEKFTASCMFSSIQM